MAKVRDFLLWVFKKSLKPVVGKGVGQRFPLAGKVFLFFYHHLSPRIILTEIQEGKLYLDSKSSLARTLLIKGSYEKGTTRLFRDLIKEGMVILDIGANIGYYSLIAAKLAGDKGVVYAFEPAPDNFAFLVKNIEVNGLSNVVPVQKAVSNKAGTDRLFLSSDPAWHGMYKHNQGESIEVQVTSVDEFTENISCPINLIKIDVEGLEMRVLEGMMETIKRNPALKIITEFSPDALQKSGSSPVGFLEKLADLGFTVHIIDEKAQVTKISNIDGIMAVCGKQGITNLFCER